MSKKKKKKRAQNRTPDIKHRQQHDTERIEADKRDSTERTDEERTEKKEDGAEGRAEEGIEEKEERSGGGIGESAEEKKDGIEGRIGEKIEDIEEIIVKKLEKSDEKLKKEIKDDILEERLIYLDLLRIIATVGVIILHIASKDWWNADDYRSDEWNAYNVWDSFTRWTVPIFVMISGALFLDNNRRITVKMLWSQNILRIFAAFLVWSAVYTIYDICNMEGDFGVRSVTVTDIHRVFTDGYYHLWYMYMIVGLYILVPLFRKISERMYLVRYFIAASLFFTFLFPNIKNIGNLDIYYNYGDSVYLEWYKSFDINMMTGYTAYFFLGYYLLKADFTKPQRIVIYMLAVGGFAATMIVTAGLYRINDFPNTIFYGNFSINVMLESMGIFVFMKNLKWRPTVKAERRLIKLSSVTFGIYLVHALVLDVLVERLEFSLAEVGNMYIAVPVLSVDVLLISAVISYMLGKVPWVRKYAV